MFDFGDLICASNIQLGYVITAAIMFCIYRLFLCLSVYSDGKERNVYRKGIWSISSLLFGVVVAIIYALCNREKERGFVLNQKKYFICVLIISLILYVFARTLFELSFTGEFGYILNP